MEQKNKCESCKKSISAIGDNRKNGSSRYTDWKGRQYHIKCYRKIMETEEKQIDRMKEYFERQINRKY
jgi:hypothetical protein